MARKKAKTSKAAVEPPPLTTAQVAKLRALDPTANPPDRVSLNVATFRLPEAASSRVVPVEGTPDLFHVVVDLSGKSLGVRAPFEKVPHIKLTAAQLKTTPFGDVKPEGFRPAHLRVDFMPSKVKLTAADRPVPPFDFKYPKGVDRPTNVFAPDQRYIYHDTSFPWCTVGRVDSPLGTGSGCTIGSRLLLTCNHVIQWNSDNTAGWVRFRPAYYNGSAPFGEAWATRVISWTKVNGSDGLTDQETAFDYVVCVLDQRMGDTVGYPGYRTYDSGWNGSSYWQHMGYPSDLSGLERPAFQGDCIVSSVGNHSTSGQTGSVLGHFNDIVGGHSGGPVWGWWNSEPWPRVVGTQSAEAGTPANNTSGDNEYGGGPALSSLISWARSNYA